MNMKVGSTIRKLRKHREMTLEDLSEVTGISVSHLSLLERDRREPSFTNLTTIADAFELPPSILVLLGTELGNRQGIQGEISKQLIAVVKECFDNDDRFPATI